MQNLTRVQDYNLAARAYGSYSSAKNNTGSVTGLSAEDDKSLHKSCRDFESLFLAQMLKKMRQTVPESKLIYGGQAEDVFRDLHDQALADQASQTEGLGIAQMLYRELAKNKGGAQ